MAPRERVTPEELDAWLRSTLVIEPNEENQGEPLYEAEPNHPRRKRKKGLVRRCSSLDKDDIFSQTFDAAMLLANEAQKDVGEEDNIFAQLNPYSAIDNNFRGIPDCHHDMPPTKKRRVSSPPSPGDLPYQSQSSQGAQPSCRRKNTPYSRLVTDDAFPLDHEAQYSRRSCRYTPPFHTIDHEARYSRRSSLYTVPSNTPAGRGVYSFLQAMELSQRSYSMLLDLKFSVPIGGNLGAMRESEMSRNLLFKMSRRTTVKNMTSAIINGGQCGSVSPEGNQYDQESVITELRRIVREEMLRSQRGQEFLRHSLGF
ncbi:hypothetical protein HJC23_000215 [Cyclotella cryptica]|uniref:Uncharacterized protein n=1 Tax=Cyclotella cryptica TaxID=29204 RepID=A0ABD3PNK9_9STRA|eukprot:CCRYP_013370-RA/>CCRYP_013370-RA protein AED:0.09 eAED:0.09 QI:212/1/1/1/0/0/2/111/312